MLSQLLASLIRRIKKSDYKVESDIPPTALLLVCLRRFSWLLRGFTKILLLQRRLALVFMAPGVSLRHAGMIRVGRGVTLEKGVIIDGLSTQGIDIGDNATIGPYTVVKASSLSHLGKGFHLGSRSSLDAFSFVGAGGGVWIGNDVIMGQHISFHAENHNFELVDRPIREQGVSATGIVVDDDCWVGSNVTFLDGVHVGTGSVIAAGAVITKDIPPYSVAAGIPACVIKTRHQTETRSYADSDSARLHDSFKV